MSGAVGQGFLMSALGGKQTFVVAAPATLSPSAHRGKGTRQRGSNYLKAKNGHTSALTPQTAMNG